jgi:transposase
MATETKINSSDKIFVGIDVGTRNWAVSVVSSDGELLERMNIEAEFEILRKILKKYENAEMLSVYEAGRWGFHLHRQLESIGVKNIITPPNKIPTLSGDLVKTDRRDSLRLATYLAKGLLKAIFIPSLEQVNLRQILKTREQIKRKRIATILQIKSLLAQYAIVFPVTGSPWNKTKARIVESLELPSKIQTSLRLFIREVEFFDQQIDFLEKDFKMAVEEAPYKKIYDRLRSIPGVGPITAAALTFEIGDVSRFSDPKKLCAFLGLTPREYSSGDLVLRGRITDQGNNMLRAFIIEAAWKTITKDTQLSDAYARIKTQTGSAKKAIVAIGRKLVCRIYFMLKKNEDYRLPLRQAA